jgi:hypothetical protein
VFTELGSNVLQLRKSFMNVLEGEKICIDYINYVCVDFFESKGITPSQKILDECECEIIQLLEYKLKCYQQNKNFLEQLT